MGGAADMVWNQKFKKAANIREPTLVLGRKGDCPKEERMKRRTHPKRESAKRKLENSVSHLGSKKRGPFLRTEGEFLASREKKRGQEGLRTKGGEDWGLLGVVLA